MKITYAGHACFIIDASMKILIDPFPVDPEKIQPDLTLITHSHSDHIGDKLTKLKNVVCIHELSQYLQTLGVNAVSMNIGGSIKVNDAKITMVKAEHSNSMFINNLPVYMGDACGYIIEMDGHTIYHAGDTGLFSDMKLIKELYSPDIAMLPAGDKFTMSPETCMIAAEFIGADVVIPMHYNTFDAIKQDLTEFRRSVELTTKSKVELMKPGDTKIF